MNRRKTVSISLPTELLAWIEKEVMADVYIKDRSHLIEIAVTEFKEKREKMRE